MDALPVLIFLPAANWGKAIGRFLPTEIEAMIRMFESNGVGFNGQQFNFDHVNYDLVDNGILVANIYFEEAIDAN